jgi:hypothetical protein
MDQRADAADGITKSCQPVCAMEMRCHSLQRGAQATAVYLRRVLRIKTLGFR